MNSFGYGELLYAPVVRVPPQFAHLPKLVGNKGCDLGSLMKKARVLVVDDEPLIRNLASAILTRHGLEVKTASDGQTALQLCLSEEFDVVLTDVAMPNMDGPELVRRLKQRREGFAAVYMTGFSYRDDLPADSTLKKPFNSEQLMVAIESRLKSN